MPGQSKESCRWVAVGKDAQSYRVLGQSKESCRLLAAASSLTALRQTLKVEKTPKKAKTAKKR
jgi:hypothetical protein